MYQMALSSTQYPKFRSRPSTQPLEHVADKITINKHFARKYIRAYTSLLKLMPSGAKFNYIFMRSLEFYDLRWVTKITWQE